MTPRMLTRNAAASSREGGDGHLALRDMLAAFERCVEVKVGAGPTQRAKSSPKTDNIRWQRMPPM